MDVNRFRDRRPTPVVSARPTELPRRPPQPAAPTPTPTPPPAEPKVIAIQINLPKIRLTKLAKLFKALQKLAAKLIAGVQRRLAGLPPVYYRRLTRVAAVLVVLMLLGGVGFGFKVKSFMAHKADTAAGKAVLAKAKDRRAAPSFTPLAPPKDSAKAATDGTSQVAYDGTRDTYSFTDKVNGNPVVVSQQPIPDKFKDAKDAVSKIAPTMKAQESVLTDAGIAYIATNPKSNSQSVVFAKDNLLVFIQSPFVHTASDWKTYINSLKSN